MRSYLFQHCRNGSFLIAALVAVIGFSQPQFLFAGEDADVLEMESKVVNSILRDDWQGVLDIMPEFLEKAPILAERFVPAFAYGAWKTGNSDLAKKLLENRTDPTSVLMARAIGFSGDSQSKAIDSMGPVPFFIKAPKKNGNMGLGIMPKSVENIALKKAFYNILPVASLDELKAFNEKVISNANEYFLGGEVISENSEVLCVAFVDIGKMREDVGFEKDGKKARVGVLTRKGSDKTRISLLEKLSKDGMETEDFGRGDFYGLGEKTKLVGIVIEITESARVSKGVLESKFKNIEGDFAITFYNAATGRTMAEVKEGASIVHIDEDSGMEKAILRSYEKAQAQIFAMLKGFQGEIKGFSGGLPPLEVSVNIKPVFSSGYKFYAKNPVGAITVKNNTPRPFGGVKAILAIKDYVDYPTEIDIGEVPSGVTLTKDLKMVFNNAIVNITDDTFLQSEIKVMYFDMGKENFAVTTQPVYVYEKHALVWDDKNRIASFITPKDPVITGFSTQAVVGADRGSTFNKNIVKARWVFAAMGSLGIEYMEDPTNPYQVVSGLTDVVDYVQFPRETLTRKVGDCDDLTSLYSSALESIGIRTKLLDAPGHLFMMFDTEVAEKDGIYLGWPEESYIINDNRIWIPVETTLVGSSFTSAWKKGAESYNIEKNEIKIIDLLDAMQTYRAPNLPPGIFKEKFAADEIDKKFSGEMEKLKKDRLSFMKTSLEAMGRLGQTKLMEVYAKEGLFDKAMELGKKLLEGGKTSILLNNMGNVYYMKGDFNNAILYYTDASLLDGADAFTLVNIARAYLKKGAKKEAMASFEKAMEIDPNVRERYGGVYVELRK